MRHFVILGVEPPAGWFGKSKNSLGDRGTQGGKSLLGVMRAEDGNRRLVSATHENVIKKRRTRVRLGKIFTGRAGWYGQCLSS